MVALNEQFTLKNPSLGSGNRVGDFFYEVEPGVGNNRLAGRFATKGKSSYSYELASGRSNWLSRDPLEFNLGFPAEFLPEGPNLYGYVGNNPINYWDPFGFKGTQGRARRAAERRSRNGLKPSGPNIGELIGSFLSLDDRISETITDCLDGSSGDSAWTVATTNKASPPLIGEAVAVAQGTAEFVANTLPTVLERNRLMEELCK
jgi:hypothetical protein